MYKYGNIGSCVVVERYQDAMCEIKQEGRSIALRTCLVGYGKQSKSNILVRIKYQLQ